MYFGVITNVPSLHGNSNIFFQCDTRYLFYDENQIVILSRILLISLKHFSIRMFSKILNDNREIISSMKDYYRIS